MLAELAERDATGPARVIYGEIRRLWAVPYVSSMQRHLATRPGWLEWVWASVGPAFTCGRAQTAAWRAVASIDTPPLPAIPRDALRVWGVDAEGEAAIRAVCASFVRVSPVNLVLSGLLRRLLEGERPEGQARDDAPWSPPPPLPTLPALVDVAELDAAARGVLVSLATTVDGRPFVPGLYRMLARWPAFLAHIATVLGPGAADPTARAACRRVEEAIAAEVPAVFAGLPPVPAAPPMPPPSEFSGVRAALHTYRRTSPEMVVFGLMIGRALPPVGEGGNR
jgi:hypothetical protein